MSGCLLNKTAPSGVNRQELTISLVMYAQPGPLWVTGITALLRKEALPNDRCFVGGEAPQDSSGDSNKSK